MVKQKQEDYHLILDQGTKTIDMQIHIMEVKTTLKNVNTYNMSSFLTNKLDK